MWTHITKLSNTNTITYWHQHRPLTPQTYKQHFSLGHDGLYVLSKALSLSSFSSIAFQTVPVLVWLMMTQTPLFIHLHWHRWLIHQTLWFLLYKIWNQPNTTNLHSPAHTCMHTHACMHTHTHVCTHTHTHTNTCMHTSMLKIQTALSVYWPKQVHTTVKYK